MKTPLLVIAAAGAVLAGCGSREPQPAASTTNNAASGNPLSAPADYAGAVVRAQQHSVKVVDTVQVQQAIRLFEASEGRLPKDLDELVKAGHLPKLPALPNGMKFQYDAKTGEVKVVPGP
jgi:hypothetical protein